VDRGVPPLGEESVNRGPLPLHDVDEHRAPLTAPEALTNLRTVLELCAAGDVECSHKTGRPSTAAIRTIGAHLAELLRRRTHRQLRLATADPGRWNGFRSVLICNWPGSSGREEDS
jgi:hypothetical protein